MLGNISRDSARYKELLDAIRLRVLLKKKCAFCGREYLAHYRGAKRRMYCSYRCRNDAYIEQRRIRGMKSREKVCQHCGADFKANRRDARYCSPRCRVATYRKRNRGFE